MRRVLLVTYYFPPLGGAGTKRMVKFARYLPDFGWEPVVLTVRQPYYSIHEPEGFTELPDSLVIERTGAFFPKQIARSLIQRRSGTADGWGGAMPRRRAWAEWIKSVAYPVTCVPDEYIGWYPWAVRAGKRIIRQYGIDAIISSSPPNTPHLIARTLSRSTGLPWLADFRDPWNTLLPWYNPHGWAPREWLESYMERRAVDTAARVSGVTEPMLADFRERLGGLIDVKGVVISNGYDPADLEGVEAEVFPRPWTILHAGSFYPWRSPQVFLQGLALWLQQNPERRAETSVVFLGQVESDTARQAAVLGVDDVLRIEPGRPYRDSARAILGADLLLLIPGSHRNLKYMMTTKIYDYLAAGKPILAVSGESAASTFLQAHPEFARVANAESPESVAGALETLYQDAKSGRIEPLAGEALRPWHRRETVRTLAQTLDCMTEAL
jgi:hypothetical protein